MKRYDYIVIGLGCVGISTLRELSKRGYNVLGLDQGSVPNPESTSYGYSRLIQYTSYTDPIYVHMIKNAVSDWKKLEEKYNTKIFFNTGTLEASHQRTDGLDKSVKIFNETNLDYKILSGKEATEKYRLFDFGDKFTILETDEGGILDAQNCLRVQIEDIRHNGGTINSHERVKHTESNESHVEVNTTKDTYKANKLIVTTGAWAVEQFDILKDLLEVKKHTYSHYLQVKNQIRQDYPGFLIRLKNNKSYYGLVEHSNDSIKLGAGTNSIDPLLGQSPVSFTRGIGTESDYPEEEASNRFLNISNKRLNRSSCMITSTQDKNPILSNHLTKDNIIFGVGMSGHGFKYSNITGRILSDIATESELDYDTQRFDIRRFEKNINQ